MKHQILLIAALAGVATATAETQTIERFLYVGPYTLQTPVMIDTADFDRKAYEPKTLLDVNLSPDAVRDGVEWSGAELPGVPDGADYAVHQLGFTLTNRSWTKGQLKLEKAPANYKLFVDGNAASAGELKLKPGTHQVTLKYLSDAKAEKPDSLSVKCTFDTLMVTCSLPGVQKELYTIEHMMESRMCYGVDLSPKGDYMVISEGQRAPGQNKRWYYLQNRLTGQRVELPQYVRWMPRTNRYWNTRKGNEGRELYTVDPTTGQEEVLCRHLPEGYFYFSPNEEFLIFSIHQEGPKEKNRDVFEVLNPEDRQPGWRDRSRLAIYDIKTGLMRPLTFGYSNCWLTDISQDGRYAIVAKSSHCFKALGEGEERERPLRPHDVQSIYRIDLQTLAIDTLVAEDGFVSGGYFSPDGSEVLFQGSPEAFERIGCTLPAEKIPSMYDYQAYILNIASREVRPVTKNFDPSISNMEWSTADGLIYITAENRDSVSLYRLDPKSGAISMLALPEENVKNLSLASQSKMLAFCGQSAMNSDRLYTLDLTKLKVDKRHPELIAAQPQLVSDFSAVTLKNIEVAECKAWTFRNSIGDEVQCRYYVPSGCDEQSLAEGSVPMITYYYGGCSPTSRNFESSYPWQCWASLGYAVLVVQPSGAAGFGQEWASRHVNTAGVDPARDITEAVREFSRTHAYINKEKIGCCGASYGGLMTQYLQTLPDCPFACAISHAGISDHTTYWGYGYWGYSYSEVSMANSFPWSETDLYVKNSPIYNVDKIHTPLLFLHGTKDVNVPINNSIQMFTALKLLGRETAMVCVEGEDHGVVEYNKRMEWLRTSLAWFQKYLKDDASWWDEMYPKKNL